jgi:hypothetical protein
MEYERGSYDGRYAMTKEKKGQLIAVLVFWTFPIWFPPFAIYQVGLSLLNKIKAMCNKNKSN